VGCSANGGGRSKDARCTSRRALASEHEQRLAAEVELDRLRTEVEGERERTREALQQAKTAGERWQRAEAEVIRLRREIEVRHHQAEEEACAACGRGRWLGTAAPGRREGCGAAPGRGERSPVVRAMGPAVGGDYFGIIRGGGRSPECLAAFPRARKG
jgi:hypothetical protein